MAERPRPLGEAELERALTDLGSRLAYPPTPELAQSVRRRLVARPTRARAFWAPFPFGRSPALALVALVVLAGAALVVSPAACTAVAERLGLRGITITYLPAVPPLTQAGASTGLRLGERLTLAEAQARVAYRILLPSLPELGAPDEVYLGQPPPDGQVALVYHARPDPAQGAEGGVGLLLTQFRGDLVPGGFGKGLAPDAGKGLGPETRLEAVTVGGAPGYWIEGQPHLFFYRDPTGQVRQENVRLVGNTLLWEQAGLTLRLESALGKSEALRIAASVR
jgi:hypothetical protein